MRNYKLSEVQRHKHQARFNSAGCTETVHTSERRRPVGAVVLSAFWSAMFARTKAPKLRSKPPQICGRTM
ncbi:hypothetical protein SRHO_G00064600 [Serrasalmus rhombeus]